MDMRSFNKVVVLFGFTLILSACAIPPSAGPISVPLKPKPGKPSWPDLSLPELVLFRVFPDDVAPLTGFYECRYYIFIENVNEPLPGEVYSNPDAVVNIAFSEGGPDERNRNFAEVDPTRELSKNRGEGRYAGRRVVMYDTGLIWSTTEVTVTIDPRHVIRETHADDDNNSWKFLVDTEGCRRPTDL